MPFRKRNGEPEGSTAYAAGAPLSAAYSRHFPRPTGEFTPKAHHKKEAVQKVLLLFYGCYLNGDENGREVGLQKVKPLRSKPTKRNSVAFAAPA